MGGMITFLRLAHILECGWWVGWVGGVGGMITFLGLAHILECGRGWVGGVGLAHIVVYGCGGVPSTCTHTRVRVVGRVGGVGGMITFLGLAHILECGRGWVGGVGLAHIVVYGCGGIPSTCTHTRVRLVGRVGGWGGWDDNVPWTCTHTRVRERVGGWGGWDVYVPWTCTHSSLRMWWDSFDLHTY